MDGVLSTLWAKARQTGPDAWRSRHPLSCHLLDVANVCLAMWDTILRESFKLRLAAAFGLDNAVAGRWVAFWVGAHDIGKASPAFQSKRPEAKALLSQFGFDFPNDRTPHGTVTTTLLAERLCNTSDYPVIEESLARRIAVAIGGHHGVFPRSGDWCDLGPSTLGNSHWDDIRKRILADLADQLGLCELPAPRNPPQNDHAAFMMLAGLTSVADWIGSNTMFFGLTPGRADTVDYAEYAKSSASQAAKALEQLGWTGWTGATEAKTFTELFPFPPRGLQVEAVRQAERMNGPGMVLIEAPMGEGKTEAALYLADHWGQSLRQQGMYVAMPTQATSNQMFGRVRDFLAKRYPEQKVNLHLLHGQAILSEEMGRLLRIAEVYDEDASHGAVVAEGWFAQNKKQGLLAPFGVGTIDQALLAVLQVKHVFVRLFGLAGKTIILDEVHAYDAYMSTLMECLLGWLSALGCSVVLLSATLPAEKRRKLLQAWDPNVVEPNPTPYPRMTVLSEGQSPVAVHIPASPRVNPDITLRWIKPDSLVSELRAALVAGGCAAVIRNTVGDAQQTYLALRGVLVPEGISVELFHARFPFGRRQEIEQEVLKRYGKPDDPNVKRPQKSVLVATQVIEQSLDIDFDLLVTDVAPVDLVLQRAGRLHRHKRDQRPIAKPEIWLLEPEGAKGGVPDFGWSEKVYDRHILLRSFLSLHTRKTINIAAAVEKLVELAYSAKMAGAPDAAWEIALRESLEEKTRSQDEDCLMACGADIDPPWSGYDIFDRPSRDLDEDNPETHRAIQAATRLTEPSVQLVLLYRTPTGLSLTPTGSEPVRLDRTPDLADAKRMLPSAISLQHRGVVAYFVSQRTPKKWEESTLVRFHRVVELDEDGYCEIGKKWTLRLDAHLGVVIGRQNSAEGIEE